MPLDYFSVYATPFEHTMLQNFLLSPQFHSYERRLSVRPLISNQAYQVMLLEATAGDHSGYCRSCLSQSAYSKTHDTGKAL